MSDVTHILNAIDSGDLQAAEQLLPLVYQELRTLAARRLAHEAPGQTLQPTALVHEAYLRLVGDGADRHWEGRRHFFAAAAEAMRRILIENARRKHRLKRGGDRERVKLSDIAGPEASDDLLALDAALTRFAVEYPAKAELVKLRYFAGLSVEDAAGCVGISRATADRWWAFARAWLYERIQRGGK